MRTIILVSMVFVFGCKSDSETYSVKVPESDSINFSNSLYEKERLDSIIVLMDTIESKNVPIVFLSGKGNLYREVYSIEADSFVNKYYDNRSVDTIKIYNNYSTNYVLRLLKIANLAIDKNRGVSR